MDKIQLLKDLRSIDDGDCTEIYWHRISLLLKRYSNPLLYLDEDGFTIMLLDMEFSLENVDGFYYRNRIGHGDFNDRVMIRDQKKAGEIFDRVVSHLRDIAA